MKGTKLAALETAALSLTQLVAKSVGDGVLSKVKAIKLQKDQNAMANAYDAIINDLVQDRAEAIRIAQAYKTEVDRIEISDDDINHLHNTIEKLIRIFGKYDAEFTKTADQINALISVDTLKAIQLLGFNYKEAIGEPLTRICADAIQKGLSRKVTVG